eukprot:TRINITY_DN37328_c0_g1_i1.p1 TRINITY_DN37328_c0_g1~~TRINITY_DN37328_c0_g1_i1.p1  ORF type:complete len:403 (+),score=76.56 TRINITY_DN37328_c0_g1_i1:60-1268(+)
MGNLFSAHSRTRGRPLTLSNHHKEAHAGRPRRARQKRKEPETEGKVVASRRGDVVASLQLGFPFYRPGDEVDGTVTLVLRKSFPSGTQFKVMLEGVEESPASSEGRKGIVYFFGDADDVPSTRVVPLVNTPPPSVGVSTDRSRGVVVNTLIHTTEQLRLQQGGATLVADGTYTQPFRLPLPENIPPTFQCCCSRIAYRISVLVGDAVHVSLPLIVHASNTRRTSWAPNPEPTIVEERPSFTHKKHGTFAYYLRGEVQHEVYAPGDRIPIIVDAGNNSPRICKGVEISLVRIVKLPYLKVGIPAVLAKNKYEGTRLGLGDELHRTLLFDIPDNAPPTILSGSFVQVLYELRLRLRNHVNKEAPIIRIPLYLAPSCDTPPAKRALVDDDPVLFALSGSTTNVPL